MKTSLLKLFSCALLAPFLLSSCLSDSEDVYTANNDFAYVLNYPLQDGTSIKAAAVSSSLYITSSVIEGLQTGQCYRLSYSMYGEVAAENVFQSTNQGDVELLPQTTGIVGVPPAIDERTAVYPNNLNLSIADPGTFFGDRWAFIYTASMKEDDDIAVSFYYDESNQREYVNGEWRDLSENQMIIDVRLVKFMDGSGTERNAQEEVVIDFTRIRAAYSNKVRFNNNETASVGIKFRYLTSVNGADPAETYSGSWASSTGNPTYYLRYTTNNI